VVSPMSGFIALALVVVLLVVCSGIAFVWLRRQRARKSGRYAQDLTPVSGQWLADHRRGG